MIKKLPFPLLFCLFLFLGQLVLSFGTPLAYLVTEGWHEIPGFLLVRLFEVAGIFLLLTALGAAFATVAQARTRLGVLYLFMAALAHLFGTLLVLVWQACFFLQAITAASLGRMLGAVVDNSLLPLFIVFLLSYFLFLKKAPHDTPRSFFDTKASPVRGALLSLSLILLYRLAGQIMETVAFVKESFGILFMNNSEKLVLVLDFIPPLLIAGGGYFLLLAVRSRYLLLSLAWERDGATEKSAKD